jgi:hypothetical protein
LAKTTQLYGTIYLSPCHFPDSVELRKKSSLAASDGKSMTKGADFTTKAASIGCGMAKLRR